MASTLSSRNARDKLLSAAGELFYARGITATGIDLIVKRAGVAKMSLYNNFASKAELVDAYIASRHDQWMALYVKRTATLSNGWERILAIFDAYRDHAELDYEDGFRGCGLLNAAAELPTDSSARKAVQKHKQQIKKIVTEHLQSLPLVDDQAQTTEQLADHICFLVEGSISIAGLTKETQVIEKAKEMADKLIEQSL